MNATLSRGGRYCGDFAVARIGMPSAPKFEREYARVGRPVIISGWVGTTDAGRKWSPRYLARTVGRQAVVVTKLRAGKLRSNNTRYMASFADYAGRAFAEDPETRGFCIQQIALPDAIAGDLPAPAIVGSWLRQPPGFWLSTPGHVTETHRDENHNLLVQVLGKKRLTLFSPIFSPALYSHRASSPLARYSRVDLDQPDLHRFPCAREATPIQVVLEAGEALFLPVHWWHRVETLEPSVSVNFWWAPPLHLLLQPGWPAGGATPQAVFAALHALADLSSFPSELDVVEALWAEGFELVAAAYLSHCMAILAANARAAPDADDARSLRSVQRGCRPAVKLLARDRRSAPRHGIAEFGLLVTEARRLATKLGGASRLRPSRWIRPPGRREGER